MANRIETYQTASPSRGAPERPGEKSEWLESLEEQISDKPLLALGVAFTVGLVLGWLVKR